MPHFLLGQLVPIVTSTNFFKTQFFLTFYTFRTLPVWLLTYNSYYERKRSKIVTSEKFDVNKEITDIDQGSTFSMSKNGLSSKRQRIVGSTRVQEVTFCFCRFLCLNLTRNNIIQSATSRCNVNEGIVSSFVFSHIIWKHIFLFLFLKEPKQHLQKRRRFMTISLCSRNKILRSRVKPLTINHLSLEQNVHMSQCVQDTWEKWKPIFFYYFFFVVLNKILDSVLNRNACNWRWYLLFLNQQSYVVLI